MFSSNHPLHPGHSLTKSQVTDLPYALREIVDLDGPAAVTAGARTTGIPRNRFKNRINYKGSLMSNPLSNILEIKIQRHFGLVGLNRQITDLKMEPGTTPSLPLAKNNCQMTDLGGLQTPPP
ncbi:zinc finger protein [Culex quinquefasciatus]|uniref:Zinc finger protein n=1 Tax=Culex quinquefasciatus TaxID=7176 RepID=B0WG04_CULQU|nr:zinc finger protein [Culex quinquefasciatus]|eukprot:XP_001847638.1 zinc finger protein [Culex quinquefasciatus]